MIYRITLSVRVDAPSETLAVRDCGERLLRMAQKIPDGERRRLFMPGDAITVKPETNPLILPYGVR
jgi:hypothetical protein